MLEMVYTGLLVLAILFITWMGGYVVYRLFKGQG